MILWEVLNDLMLFMVLVQLVLGDLLDVFCNAVDDFLQLVLVGRLELGVDLPEVVLIKGNLLAPDFREENEDRIRVSERLDREDDGHEVDNQEEESAYKLA
jgi:hypothetical protein